MNYASIVPLIGGETIAMEQVFGKRPDLLLSYTPFKNNDQHIVAYYKNEVPYTLLDEDSRGPKPKIGAYEVVNTVCPCAGLSALSPSSSANSATNDWMIRTAEYVLESMRPLVFWGENAPRLGTKMGEPTVNRMRAVAKKNGYVLMIYKTKSLLHGLSQIRDRTFYFFFLGNTIPEFPFFQREHELIEDTIRNTVYRCPEDSMRVLTNKGTPSQDPFYRYVLEVLFGGITHRQFREQIDLSTNPLDVIEASGHDYLRVAKWMEVKGYSVKIVTKCMKMYVKLKAGGNIMRKSVEIPKDYIGAFVGHNPDHLTHPDDDRYLTIRECLNIMCLPVDFDLQGGLRNLNHICQNVPVKTAADMAQCVKDYLGGTLNEGYPVDFMIIDNKTKRYEITNGMETLENFLT